MNFVSVFGGKKRATLRQWMCAALALAGASAPACAQQQPVPAVVPPPAAAQPPAAAPLPAPGPAPAAVPLPPGEEPAAVPQVRTFGWSVLPSLHVLETLTSNGYYGNGGPGSRADLISDVGAGVTIVGRTPRLQVDGAYALRSLEYARGSQGNRIEPNGDLNAKLEAIDRHLFVDGSLLSTRVLNSPLSAGAGTESTVNSSTVTAERVAPYLLGRLAGGVQYRLRSENGWTQASSVGVARSDASFANHSFDIERPAEPIGVSLTAQREQSSLRAASSTSTVDDSARIVLRVAPWPDLTLGARYGVESDNYGLTSSDRSGRIIGADLSWIPSPRTEAQGYYERRLFGARWHFGAEHRTPFLAVSLISNRLTTTSALALFNLGGREDLWSLLDAIYTTRYPDPIERSRVVGQMAAADGLPTSLVGPIGVFDQNLTRITEHRLAIALKGRLSTVGIALYGHRNEALRPLVAPPVFPAPLSDSYQSLGASVTYTLRLAPQTTGTLACLSSRTTGIGALQGEETTESSVALSFSEHLSPRLDATAGTGHRWARSNVVSSGQETSVFAGLAWHL
jgi:uncharacterized protein (PEP-CTERM system associated)